MLALDVIDGDGNKYWRRNSESNRGTRICNPNINFNNNAGFGCFLLRKVAFFAILKAPVYAGVVRIAKQKLPCRAHLFPQPVPHIVSGHFLAGVA